MEFTFHLPESTAEFKFDAARLSESHPRLKELRSRMLEKAGGNERLVDNELGLRFFDALHKFGDGYVREMSGLLERIFKTRDDLTNLYDSAAKGNEVTADAVKAKFDQLADDMAKLKAPDKALDEKPTVELPPKDGPAAPKDTPLEPDLEFGGGTEADLDAMLDDLENKAEVPRVEGGRIDGKKVPGPPRRPRDPAKWPEWSERVAKWFGRRADKLNIWDLVRRSGETFRGALGRMFKVMGTKISDHPDILKVWNAARDKVLAGRSIDDIGRDEMLAKGEFSGKQSIYDKVRDQFWADLRDPKNSAGRKIFEDAGFVFGDELAPNLETTNPKVNKGDTKMSLDHSAEKAQGENWKKAVDGDNLAFEFADPNTFREIWQVRHKVRQPK
jgi:hypothetical protein